MDLKNTLQIGLIVISCGAIYFAGYSSGSSSTEAKYQEKIIEQLMEERRLIQENRTKEEEWRQESRRREIEYQNRIASIRSSNDAVVKRLRKQLDAYADRLSSNSDSSSKLNAEDRRANLSEEIKRLVDFSDKCARRADELIVQVNALQEWINKITY